MKNLKRFLVIVCITTFVSCSSNKYGCRSKKRCVNLEKTTPINAQKNPDVFA